MPVDAFLAAPRASSSRWLLRPVFFARGLLLGGSRCSRGGLRLTSRGLGLDVAGLRDVELEVELGAASPTLQGLRATEQQRPALGARVVLLRRVADRAVAVGIAAAAVEDRAEPAPLLDQLALSALRARHAGRDGWVLLDVPAIRIAAAPGERSVPADLALELPAALGAGLVEHLGLGTNAAVHVADVAALGVVGAADELAVSTELDLELPGLAPLSRTQRAGLVELLAEPLERVLGLLERALEGTVELLEHRDLAQVALGDVVELPLHVGGEGDVDHVGEVLDQLVGHDLARIGGLEPLLLERHVLAALDRLDDRGVRRRPPDAELLERLHERGFGVSRRRLREVLLGEHLEHAQHLLDRERRKGLLRVLVGTLVAALLVDADEPVERHRLPRGAQAVVHIPVGRISLVRGASLSLVRGASLSLMRGASLDIHADLVEAGLGHLGGHRALPDQGVQTQLVAIQRRGDALGRTHHARGSHGLVRFLRVAAARLVPAWLRQRVPLAVLAPHELADLAERGVGDRHGVGPHVGDQPDRALPREIDALVEALGERHRLAGAEPELAGRFLLQGRRGERRSGRSLALLLLDIRDPVGGAAQALDVNRRIGLGAEEHALLVGGRRELPVGHLGEPGGERLIETLGSQPDVDAPVLDRHEGTDLALALDDQPHGDRLHPAGRQSGTDLLPQQRRDAVAHQPVEDAAGLLGVVELQVDRARLPERIEDRVARDLGERDSLGGGGVNTQQHGHVIGDRLAFAVVVRREDQVARAALQRLPQLAHMTLGVLGHHVVGRERMLHVDAEAAVSLAEVPDVAIGSTNGVLAAQVLLDRLRLRGRFDDHEGLAGGHARNLSDRVGKEVEPAFRRPGGLDRGCGARGDRTIGRRLHIGALRPGIRSGER